MTTPATITSVEFRNYKALKDYSVILRSMNILVGANNAGKSTVLGAFRILAEALKRAQARAPELIGSPSGPRYGYQVPTDSIPVSVENVHTDYAEDDTTVRFELSNGNDLLLYFPPDGGCYLFAGAARVPRTPAAFRSEFPISVGVVPVLGPVEHDEAFLTRGTVQSGLTTHRASRHFRNYWYYYPEGFDDFANLVSATWPGMSIRRPELALGADRKLHMFCEEDRISRELYWAGFGFQVWCQLLTHIVRARTSSVLIIDEPDIYLHADLQRRLVGVLREAGPVVMLATHSAEIIAEADPTEVVVVNKAARAAQRIRDVDGVRIALERLGSLKTNTLARLARARAVVFAEQGDLRLVRQFARHAGFRALADAAGLLELPLDGTGSWERLADFSETVSQTLGGALQLGAVLGREFRGPEEQLAIEQRLSPRLRVCHLLAAKEVENYLLVPAAIDRVLAKQRAQRSVRTAGAAPPRAADLLKTLTEPLRQGLLNAYIAQRQDYLARQGAPIDRAALADGTSAWFDECWADEVGRLALVPGRLVFSSLCRRVATEFGVELTPAAVIDEMAPSDIAPDLRELLTKLDRLRLAAE